MNLAKFPRIRCGHFPTPLEPMENLTKHLGGPQLWIKRDDCTGLSTGGNKTRKLEFLMAEAVAQKADTVITQGATQSNHARQTAADRRQARHGLPYPARGPHRLRRRGLQLSMATCCSTSCTAPRSRSARAAPTCRRRWRSWPPT